MVFENEIRKFAWDTRGVMEPGLLRDGDGGVLSAGSCLHMSVMAQYLMRRFKICDSIVRGGNGSNETGCQGRDGSWNGHYWLECFNFPEKNPEADGLRFVMDLTADQFGWDAVRVIALEKAKGYSPSDQSEVDEAAEKLRQDFQIGV